MIAGQPGTAKQAQDVPVSLVLVTGALVALHRTLSAQLVPRSIPARARSR